MASRGAFGFRAKQTEKDDTKAPPTTQRGLARKGSITSGSSIPPKMPTQSSSSFFSRSKKATADASSSRLPAPSSSSSSTPMTRDQYTPNPNTFKNEPAPPPKTEYSRATGLGISSGNNNTTVQVTKSGKTRNVLRRKAPLSDSRSGYARTESSASSYDPPPSRMGIESKSTPEGYRGVDPFANSVLGITAPSVPSSSVVQAPPPPGLGPSFEFDTSSSRMARFNSRKGLSASPNPSLPAPTPNYAHDSGSSTRRSESPGAFSRTSTPTSMSSQSPGVSTPYNLPIRQAPPRQKSPVRLPTAGRSRPPVALETRRGRGLESSSQGLTAVRESGTSSSSSSTVKASGSRDEAAKTPLSDRSSPRPFSPPSRTSSHRQVVPPGSASSLSRGHATPSPSIEQQRPTAMTTRLPKTSAEISTVMRRVDQPVRSKTAAPPARPSREGVPTLVLSEEDKLNLERGLSRPGIAPSLGRSPSNVSSAAGQRSQVTSPDSQATESAWAQERRPSIETNVGAARAAKDPSPQSAGSTKSSSRFGFLRRNKSPEKSVERAPKKGPAAGTGHEGYGKHARRGRSGSFSTNASRGRSTSSTSVGRTPSSRKSSLTSQNEGEMDEFYRNRLEPKKIVGSGQSVMTASAQGSNLSLDDGAPGSSNTFAVDPVQQQFGLETNPRQNRNEVLRLEPKQARALRHVGRMLPSKGGTGQSSAGENDPRSDDFFSSEHGAPTLATRRSMHRSLQSTDAAPLKIPAPIDTRATTQSPALDSQNTYQSSVPQSDSTIPLSEDISEGHEGNWLHSKNQEKPTKSPKRWAFFHRAVPSPRKPPVPATPKSGETRGVQELRAQVAPVPESQSVAFYEMMNQSEQDDLGDRPVSPRTEDYSEQYQSRTGSITAEDPMSATDQPPKNASMLLPSPPILDREFPVPPMAPTNDSALPLPSALTPASSQLDTLPEPPAALPEPRKPRLQQIGRIPRVVSKRDRTHKPPPQSFSRPRPYTPRQDPPSSAPTMMGSESGFPIGNRPVLEVQTEQIPSNPWGTQESAKPSSAPVTLAGDSIVQRGDSSKEFLTFPSRIGSSVSAATTSSGLLSYVDLTSAARKGSMAPSEEEEWNEYNDFLDIMESPAPLANQRGDPYDKTAKRTVLSPAPLEIRKGSLSNSSGDSTTKLHGATYPPATPPTRKLPSPPKRSKQVSPPPPAPDQESEKGSSKHKRSSSRYSTSSIESEVDSLAGQENSVALKVSVPAHLRLELLTTSKLLSFDRVLFSPAHAEISSNRKNRVLILDGLGIDDWAFYCAQEYPDAQISNLSPVPRTVNSANYDHHYYSSLDGPFPFPQSFFTAGVFRFPAATSEEAYSNVIKEFRRVLCPGGYLEISVMDLDMVKMGQTTRRALRGLKQRKQSAEPQVSLKPLSDNIQKMLGGKAFENLKQCMLEIPVAGTTSSSRVRSFNEKMEFIDEMPRDEDRTKHLPEIGRWWYSRCYEQGPRPSGAPPTSIWDDTEVLKECEDQETGFKLLLCYAQKPNKRRTLSL